jgi:hypothetical protein
MKKNALFISQDLFLGESILSGGVTLCTKDYMDVISTNFNLIPFPIKTKLKIIPKILNKLGLLGYHPISLSKKDISLISNLINEKEVEHIFINHAYISSISISLKDNFQHIKVILCSHGNESGDFLHQITRFSDNMNRFSRLFGTLKLGILLSEEVKYRRFYIDVVLTVSEIEESLEKWLGAKQVFFLPRIFEEKFISWNPKNNRVGFVSDISHEPNYDSVFKLCLAIDKSNLRSTIKIRLIGKDHPRYTFLTKTFSFVECTGYLNENDIIAEMGSWHYYLNLVDYYSKGVSTKMAYGMNFGIPVISTKIGARGYYFPLNTGPIILENIDDIVSFLSLYIDDIDQMNICKENVKKAVLNFSNYNLFAPIISKI